MDLHTVETLLRPTRLDELPPWQPGMAWLAGGTWLFTEPQPQVKTLVDLQRLGWDELAVTEAGLVIGATCVMSRLVEAEFPEQWGAIAALRRGVHALASFKVQNVATVVGNLCLALPAGTFAPVMVALGARYEVLSPGRAAWIEAVDFQTGARRTILQPGDVVRRVLIPREFLTWQTTYQRICVASAGLALAIVVTAYNPMTQQVRVGIGAVSPAPKLLTFAGMPTAEEVAIALNTAIPLEDCIEDDQASAAYRREMARVLLGRSLAPFYGPTRS